MTNTNFTEKEFTKIFLNKISSRNSTSLFLEEVDCGQGRADIVQASFDNNLKKDENFLKFSYIQEDLTSLKIISLLHYNSYRKREFLYSSLGLQKNKIDLTLKKLIELKIVKETQLNCFILHSDFQIPETNIISYELKLHNWKRALYQAIQYKGFSNKSFVVMPNNFIHSAFNNIDYFKANNIGLISVDHDGSYKILLNVKKEKARVKYLKLKCIGQFISVS